MRHAPELETVLAAVLAAHGPRCQRAGACGRTHPAGTCGIQPFGRIIAAPSTPYPTDHENVGAPADDLRPWCGPCWSHALALTRNQRAQTLQRILAENQLGLFEL
ncbi:hypothetical protein [Streptomyces sp. NPDC051162]|uniref:hypothetical protein n=1 Tax=Streptomyces sp. NPDC051162 TaxID=3154747 RepID=UPI003436B80D